MIRKVISMLMVLLAVTVANGASTVTISNASASIGEETSVAVNYNADNADAVALELRLPLSGGIKYVEGSARKSGSRLSGHQISASQNGDELVILVYNVTLSAIPTGDGEILTFKLKSGKQPGEIALSPVVKLSDRDGESIPVTTQSANFTTVAPRLVLSTNSIDFGRVPIRESYQKSFYISNTGTSTLSVKSIQSERGDLKFSPSSLAIEPGSGKTVNISYSPTEYADGVSHPVEIISDSYDGEHKLTIVAVPYSVNKLLTQSASGVSDGEVTIRFMMENMEPIVGADVMLVIPEELKYVEGSLACGERAQMLEPVVGKDGNRLRVLLYGASNLPVDGNEGELFSFKVKLEGRSGSYYLYPASAILSNRNGRNMTSDITGGYVSIESPSIVGASSMDMGNLPAMQRSERNYQIRNNGDAALTIEKVTFLSEGFEVATELPMTIQPRSSSGLQFSINPVIKGRFATTMNIYSNDPAQRLKTVALEGEVYSPNELTFSGEISDDYSEYVLTAFLENAAPIVALQMDIKTDEGITTSADNLILSSRANGHSATLAQISEGLYRVIIFSFSNTPFNENEGKLFSLTFSGDDLVGKKISIENIILSSRDGENFTTPGSELNINDIHGIPVSELRINPDIEEIKVGETLQLKAELLPENAYDKRVAWSSSNESIATVSKDGLVTVLAVGHCVITASTLDGSSLTAECKLDVSVGVDSIFESGNATYDIHTIDGMLIKKDAAKDDFDKLSPGIYIAGGRKIVINRK